MQAQNVPQKNISLGVGFLHINHGYIRPNGGDRRKSFSGGRALNKTNILVVLRQFRASVRPQNRERKIRSAGYIGVGKISVTVFLNLERMRPVFFDRIAQTVKGTDSGISAPRKD